MNVQEYLNELAKTAGLDEESKAGLTKVLGNTKFVEELDKGVKRQSDYSRSMDELKTERSAVETQIKQWREWYNSAVTNDAAREEELKELRTKVGGNGSGNGNDNGAGTVTGMTEKQIRDLLAGESNRILGITKDMGYIASRHSADFHEALDTEAVAKIAVEKGLTVIKAYEELIAPRVKEQEAKAWDEKLKVAREEGLKEGLSKRDLPDESTRGFHPIHDHAKSLAESGKLTDSQRRENFINTWQESVKK